MTPPDDVHEIAVRIVIEEAELGLAPEGWPAWTDVVRYVPAEADAREASQLFGELEDDLNVAEFTAWLDGLQSERFIDDQESNVSGSRGPEAWDRLPTGDTPRLRLTLLS